MWSLNGSTSDMTPGIWESLFWVLKENRKIWFTITDKGCFVNVGDVYVKSKPNFHIFCHKIFGLNIWIKSESCCQCLSRGFISMFIGWRWYLIAKSVLFSACLLWLVGKLTVTEMIWHDNGFWDNLWYHQGKQIPERFLLLIGHPGWYVFSFCGSKFLLWPQLKVGSSYKFRAIRAPFC